MMTKVARKRPGRPRKNPDEKPEQFSIRLPAQTRLILEGYARLKNTSLSQAVGHLLTENANNYKVGDIGLLTAIQTGYRKRVAELQAHASADNPTVDLQWLDRWRTWLLTSDTGKLMVMPREILSEEEVFVVAMLEFRWTELSPEACERLAGDIRSMSEFYATFSQIRDFVFTYPAEPPATHAIEEHLVKGFLPADTSKNPTPRGPVQRKKPKAE